jgi:hypothetical protein
MRELALPIFDGATLPGSTYTYGFDPEDNKAETLVVHQRPLNARKRSIYVAQADELEAEIKMAESRQSAEKLIRELVRRRGNIDSRLFNDLASAVVVHGNWIADGTSFTNSTTENTIAMTPLLAGSGAAIESTTYGADASGGFWYPGRALRIFWTGAVSSAASSPGNLTINGRLNTHTGNALGASAANALAVSMATVIWSGILLITCRTIGAAGTLESSVVWDCVLSATQATDPTSTANTGHNVAIDTTANNSINITALFSAASASNIILTRQFIAEVLS